MLNVGVNLMVVGTRPGRIVDGMKGSITAMKRYNRCSEMVKFSCCS